MSSNDPEDRKGTPPSRNLSNNQTATGAEPLSKSENNRLYALGYKNEHIAELSPESARAIIAGKTPRPGSKAALKANAEVMRKAGLPDPGVRFSDEEIEKRNVGRAEPSGVVVTLDAYSQEVLAGRDPIDAKLLDLERRFPGNRFRGINPNLPTVAGPQFQQVYDDKGQAVKVGDLMVGFMPEEIYDQAYRQPNLERSRQMSGQIPKNVDQVREDPNHPVPVTGRGMTAERSMQNF